jgi:hypothetical protein
MLHCTIEQLPRHAQMQRGKKAPEGALRRQLRHAQDADQHRFKLQKAQMIEAREPHVAGQNHSQNEPEHGHGARLSLHGQGFLNQPLKAEILQHMVATGSSPP